MNILIADDSQLIRTTLQRLISTNTEESEFHFAENVEEAINCLAQYQIELLILDIRMPGGSGFDVLKEAKKKNMITKVIMLTNYATASYRNKAEKEGVDYFFDKSTDYEKLIQILKNEENLKKLR
jgi:DNA-binding NarL/FixJ family response regulator